MLSIFLFILEFVLLEPDSESLPPVKDSEDRCGEFGFNYKKIDWDRMLCRNLLLVFGDNILAEIKYPPDLLCSM